MCVVGKDAEIRGGLRIPASFCLFGDSICMETLFWCTYVRMKPVANDCTGYWSVKVYLFSTIGVVFVQKVRYVWM